MAVGRLASVALDCADPLELARFWASLLDGEVAFTSDEFSAVKLPGSSWLATVRVDDYRPPTWPDAERPKQMHLDLAVADLDTASRDAVALGASVEDTQSAPDRWRCSGTPLGTPSA